MPATTKSSRTSSEHGFQPKVPRPEAARRCHSTDETTTTPRKITHNQKVDRFGFITNIDSNGKILPTGSVAPEVVSEEEIVRMERREKKWSNMMQTWETTNKRRQKLVLNRLRKGLPDTMRGKVWPLLGGVNKKLREGSSTKGLYQALLRQCEEENQNALDHMPPEGPNKSKSALMVRSNSFQNIQETIERDIHRTFPRHSLFYEEENHRDDIPPPKAAPAPASPPKLEMQIEDEDDSHHNLGALCNEDLTVLMQELEVGTSNAAPAADEKKKKKETKPAAGNDSIPPPSDVVKTRSTCETLLFQNKGGQAALRRVLCAYSYYDREVGYCQGMNFIAAMFITIMPEEQAFWMLVAVMNENPCHMRGLFGKGMSETHKVLYVAEKLLHHFLPKLAKHLDKENVHVTMYATQWLLTQYTSSFNFDLVTRVWDCFLVEGFKTIYRVMLALLTQVQPILLKKSFEEILGFFRTMPDVIDGSTIMETAMKIPLKRKHIAKYENEWLAQQQQQS